MEVEMSGKELVDSSSGEKKRQEHEVVSLIVKEVRATIKGSVGIFITYKFRATTKINVVFS